MAFNYAPLASTARNLITDFGQSVTFSRIAETHALLDSGQPNFGAAMSVTTSTYTAVVVVLDEAKSEQGDTATIGVVHNALASSDSQIVVGDTATINSQSFRVVSVKEVKPATTVVVYELQLTS
jgi:hypothetical protein